MTSAVVVSTEHLLGHPAPLDLGDDWRSWHRHEDDADRNDLYDDYLAHLDANYTAIEDVPEYCELHVIDALPPDELLDVVDAAGYTATPAGDHAWSDQYTCGCCAERIATDAVPVAEPFDRATAPVWSTASELDIILTAETITAEHLQRLLLAETDPPESPRDLVDTLTSAPAGPPAARCLTVAR